MRSQITKYILRHPQIFPARRNMARKLIVGNASSEGKVSESSRLFHGRAARAPEEGGAQFETGRTISIRIGRR